MKVITRVGEIEGPDSKQVHPRVKYWAEAIHDVIKTEELFCVMGAAMEEAYRAGARDQFVHLMNGFAGKGEIIDADCRVVEASGEELVAEGPESEESVGDPEGAGSVEQAVDAAVLPGCVPESPECLRGDEAEVAEVSRP